MARLGIRGTFSQPGPSRPAAAVRLARTLGVAIVPMSLFSFLKGWSGETMGSIAHRIHLDKAVYTPLDNVTLPTANGTTQIDHVIASRFGLFVIEAKNIDGWIFGQSKSSQWTVVKPGRKHKFPNPLHQNYRHVRAVVEMLGVEETKVHSMVMFWGECEFKTPMPPNVLRDGYATYIKGFSQALFTDEEVNELVEALKSGAMPKTWATRRAHLASLKARHSSTTTCPKCGGSLIVRTARTGANSGSMFFGCSGYPKCRFTRPHASDA